MKFLYSPNYLFKKKALIFGITRKNQLFLYILKIILDKNFFAMTFIKIGKNNQMFLIKYRKLENINFVKNKNDQFDND